MMRRYRLKVGEREFAIDVQEQTADRYAVSVGGEAYEVTLAEDANPSAVSIAPRPTVALPPSRPAVTAGGKGALTAPMPGVILEVNVKAGDTVTRGQQVAILDAMKMHNMIGATQDGTVAEVYVAAGQSVDHGTPILKYKEA